MYDKDVSSAKKKMNLNSSEFGSAMFTDWSIILPKIKLNKLSLFQVEDMGKGLWGITA